jgi:hypothetical protein
LQFLTFTLQFVDPLGLNQRGSHIINQLSDASITGSLKELTIAIHAQRNLRDGDWLQLFHSHTWHELDVILGSAPALQRVLIYFDVGPYYRTHSTASVLETRDSLPLLNERGIVSVEMGRIEDLEADIWLTDH